MKANNTERGNNMKFRRMSQVVCATLILSSMSAVFPTTYAKTTDSTTSTSASQTIKYGKVTSVSKTKIKVALGEIKMDMPQGGQDAQGSQNMPGGFGGMAGGTPPDMGNMPGGFGGMAGGTPPDMGSMPGGFGGMAGGTPPDMGNMQQNGQQNGQLPEMPDMSDSFTASGEALTITVTGVTITKMGQTVSVSDISKGDILTLVYTGSTLTEIKIGVDPFGGQGGEQGKPMGSQAANVELKSKYTADGKSLSISSKTVKSTAADTSAVLAKNSGKFTVKSGKLNKTGDSSNVDSSNFYGLNAIAVALTDSSLSITCSTLQSDAEGANAVFAAGEDAKATVKNTTIITKGNSSRGLDATLGGTITADNVKIKTSGAHCAPVATDRGGGKVTVKNSTLQAAGDGSPCIYSTGDISAYKCTGKATGSQIAVVEGKNSITLSSCTLTGAGNNGIMLYQSTSGDAEVGTAVLTSKSSTLKTTSKGPMFYITNTDAVINLQNNKLSFSSGILLDAAGNNTNNWGVPGKNGGTVELNAVKQTMKGSITCDEISSVKVSLKTSSALTGAIDTANTGDVSITLDKTSKWNVTGDSYVTSLKTALSDYSNIISNGYTIYYDSANSDNSALGGKTITLPDGGKLAPM